MMIGIVTLSFTLLSTAFMLLSYRYIISETRDRLERNAGYIAAATSNYLQNVTGLNWMDDLQSAPCIRAPWRRSPTSPTPLSLWPPLRGDPLRLGGGYVRPPHPRGCGAADSGAGRLHRDHQLERAVQRQPVHRRPAGAGPAHLRPGRQPGRRPGVRRPAACPRCGAPPPPSSSLPRWWCS